MPNEAVCPLCGGRESQLLADKVRFDKAARVRKCLACDLVYLDQKSFQFPRDFYEGDYHQTYLTHVEPDALDPKAYYDKMLKATKIWADRFGAMLTGKETVLDVGCSTGHFLDLIKGKAKSVCGSELNKKEVAFCQDVLKLDVSDKPLEQRFEKGTFDYITMIYVLEHIAEPKPFLENLKKFLKPGGKMVILVPNIRDALVNFYDIPEFRPFYYCIEHLFYYSPTTIRRLFDSVGLKGSIETLQEYPITNHLNWGYRCKPSDTLASRRGVPDIRLTDGAPEDKWNELWAEFNMRYRQFLTENSYGDRLWCVVGQ